jgi:hypothetical protein
MGGDGALGVAGRQKADSEAVASSTRKRPRRNEVGLVLSPNMLPDSAIHGLVDDLLVPLVVDHLIRRATGE